VESNGSHEIVMAELSPLVQASSGRSGLFYDSCLPTAGR
jgi:hypothetical protein